MKLRNKMKNRKIIGNFLKLLTSNCVFYKQQAKKFYEIKKIK